MEYAVPVIVVAVFIMIYLLTRPKIKPTYFDEYDEETYKAEAESFVKSLNMPKEGGSKTDAKRYISKIKKTEIKIKMRKYCGFFDKFASISEELKAFLKTDFTQLDMLPSIDGESRSVKIARFCLARSDFEFSDDRIKHILEVQNNFRTLSYSEIMAMKKSFEYVILENICYIYLQLDTLAKIYVLSAKYVYNPILLDKKYKKLAKSKLFLSICALRAGYRMEFFSDIHAEVTDALLSKLQALLSTVKKVEAYDFTRYYTPLEILDKFENFSHASVQAKQNFLALIKEASDKENLDEFLYTVRLEKYMRSASAGHIRVKRFGFLSHIICVFDHKRDITMLATALGSKHFMNLYFEPNDLKKRKIGKSISKILEYENTFEPIYKFHTINFGISTTGGRLRITPSLPKSIVSADVIFEVNQIQNRLHIVRGEEKQLYLGETLISGTDNIRLGKTPLDITIKVPKDLN